MDGIETAGHLILFLEKWNRRPALVLLVLAVSAKVIAARSTALAVT